MFIMITATGLYHMEQLQTYGRHLIPVHSCGINYHINSLP